MEKEFWKAADGKIYDSETRAREASLPFTHLTDDDWEDMRHYGLSPLYFAKAEKVKPVPKKQTVFDILDLD